jgi:hypothetical protein
MRSSEKRPFLAPWWASPQVAYWSGQPGITGTSHQSLSGIVDSARFYLAEKPESAAAILRARGVRYVIIDDLSRTAGNLDELLIVSNSLKILAPEQAPAKPLGDMLARAVRPATVAPPYLRFISPEERGLVAPVPQPAGAEAGSAPASLHLPQYHQLYLVQLEKL